MVWPNTTEETEKPTITTQNQEQNRSREYFLFHIFIYEKELKKNKKINDNETRSEKFIHKNVWISNKILHRIIALNFLSEEQVRFCGFTWVHMISRQDLGSIYLPFIYWFSLLLLLLFFSLNVDLVFFTEGFYQADNHWLYSMWLIWNTYLWMIKSTNKLCITLQNLVENCDAFKHPHTLFQYESTSIDPAKSDSFCERSLSLHFFVCTTWKLRIFRIEFLGYFYSLANEFYFNRFPLIKLLQVQK